MAARPGRRAVSRARVTATADLVITNGDAAGELLRRTLPTTEVLPWRDVLHEGPVPLTDTLAELTAIRAAYLAGRGWGDATELRENLEARNRGLAQAEIFDRVVLWFEHDLYDQLQLLQVLDWFNENRRAEGALLLVQTSQFLASRNPEQILDLKDWSARSPMSSWRWRARLGAPFARRRPSPGRI